MGPNTRARQESWARLEQAVAEQRDLHLRYPSAGARRHYESKLKGKGKVSDAPCRKDDFFVQDCCGICMDRVPIVGYLPCRHVVACLQCQKLMGLNAPCPVCRCKIKSYQYVPGSDGLPCSSSSSQQHA